MNTDKEAVGIAGAASIVLSSGVALVAVLWPGRLDALQTAAIILFGNSVIGFGAIVFARARVWSKLTVLKIQAKAAATGETPPLTDPP